MGGGIVREFGIDMNTLLYAPQLLSLCSRAHEPQLLSPCATTTEARAPKAHALQQEKPPQ